MIKGILANYHDDGRVEIMGTHIVDFMSQVDQAQSVRKLTDLAGWDQWQAIYAVDYDGVNYGIYATNRRDIPEKQRPSHEGRMNRTTRLSRGSDSEQYTTEER